MANVVAAAAFRTVNGNHAVFCVYFDLNLSIRLPRVGLGQVVCCSFYLLVFVYVKI